MNYRFFADRPLDALAAVVKSEATYAIATGTHTHDPGVQWVWERVSDGWSGSEITDGFEQLLPADYAGDSREQVPEWIRSARKKQAESQPHDLRRKAKAPPVAQVLLKTMVEEGAELFHDALKRC